ncbi:MAG: NAD(P)/FAD-dependent oxidoreductase [Qingshengfaniella sp.]
MTGSFTEPPYAISAVPAPATGRLTQARTADFILVGAGYGGLLSALHLAERGARVIVLEAAGIGHGGSGRNHGQCIPIYGYLDPDTLPAKGFDLLLNSGALVFDMIRDRGLNCEAAQNGTLMAAYNPRTLRTTRAAQAKYARFGKASAYLGQDEITELTGTRLSSGGWVHPEGGHLNPLAYSRELARIALAAGVEIYTDSPMISYRRDNGTWILRTPEGEARAATVGLTTEAYSTDALPRKLTRGFFLLEGYAIASRPLTPEQRTAVMPTGMNFGDTHRDPMFFRIDAQGRIISGGLREPRRGTDFGYTASFMTRRLSRFFPVLDGLEWDYMWTGTISMALDQIPSIQPLDDGLWALSGWSGRGVPTSAALSQCFARTLEDPRAGLDYWPQRQPPRVLARALLGQLVQHVRGPFNQVRDRIGL